MNALDFEKRAIISLALRAGGRDIRTPRGFVGQQRRELTAADLLQRPVYGVIPDSSLFTVDSSAVDGPDPIG